MSYTVLQRHIRPHTALFIVTLQRKHAESGTEQERTDTVMKY